jgi:very-short-patch-repair endonuclease
LTTQNLHRKSIQEWISGMLQNELKGIFTHRLVRSRQELGVGVEREHVVDALLDAQGLGELRFQQRRWLCQGPYDDPEREDSNIRPRQKSRHGGLLKAIDCTVLTSPRSSSNIEEQAPSSPSDQLVPDWDFFRVLATHYRECLHLGGASRCTHNAERHQTQFHLLNARGRWWPDEAGSRPIRISRKDLGGPFLEALAKRHQEPILIGYPISVGILPDETRLVTPACILQCEWSLDDAGLTITPISGSPILNPDWVRTNRKRQDFKRTLKQLADLAVDEADSDLSLVGAETWSNVPGLAQTLTMFLPGMIRRKLNPAMLERQLNLDVEDSLQNVLGLFLVSDNPFSKGCRSDLLKLSTASDGDLSKTALSAIFEAPAKESEPLDVVSPLPMSEDQFLAIRDGLTNPVTVISGPPGTGKSQVVSSLILSAAAAGKSVLFASHTHKAIDAVFERVDSLSDEHILLLRASGDEERGATDLKSALRALLNRLRDPDETHSLVMSLADIKQRNSRIKELIALADQSSDATNRLGQLWIEKASRERLMNEIQGSAPDLKIEISRWRRLLIWLRPIYSWLTPSTNTTKNNFNDFESINTKALDAQIASAERDHKAIVSELETAHASGTTLSDAVAEVSKLSEDLIPLLGAKLGQATPEERQRLVDLSGNVGLASTTNEKLEVWREKTDLVLKHFPLWAATTLAIPNRLPLVPGMFDYLVIDEATTANIAEALPLLYRAKRVVIVGDRMQTGMISDLVPAREAELLRRADINTEMMGRFSFSQISLFDFFNSHSRAKRHMLRDHFRCAAEIAEFFSDAFYGGRLFVRTDPKALKPPARQRVGCHWTDITGPIESAGKGAVSQSEAQAIVDHLFQLIETEGYKGTLGVVTPFKKQAELIRRKVEAKLPLEKIRNANLLVDTAHKFQGDARDVVLISLCYSNNMPRGAAWFLGEGQEWLNVAVSRARAVCHIFGNRAAAEGSSIPHIRKLARHLSRSGAPVLNQMPVFESPWERKLYEALKQVGIETITQYPLAGRRLDLAIIKGDIRLDIEVDGETYHRDPDGFRKTSDLWRDHVVSGLGWRVCRFWVYELRENMEKCVERIERELKK